MVDDKWLPVLDTGVRGEIDRVTIELAKRAKELAERYEISLPGITGSLKELESKISRHFISMGFSWN